ncbi:hypothetical protein PAPYR_5002 [Paratrimastix pyriformis]|uniref:Uncharacterized protein n=1 Tax=Paratrimastix pyriformis TaxID=342808 RepID=A0ABQ8UMH2_9EUKA|nr:hypothetical protein PAPYR_5002 [Paratrimastix pyriformis]
MESFSSQLASVASVFFPTPPTTERHQPKRDHFRDDIQQVITEIHGKRRGSSTQSQPQQPIPIPPPPSTRFVPPTTAGGTFPSMVGMEIPNPLRMTPPPPPPPPPFGRPRSGMRPSPPTTVAPLPLPPPLIPPTNPTPPPPPSAPTPPMGPAPTPVGAAKSRHHRGGVGAPSDPAFLADLALARPPPPVAVPQAPISAPGAPGQQHRGKTDKTTTSSGGAPSGTGWSARMQNVEAQLLTMEPGTSIPVLHAYLIPGTSFSLYWRTHTSFHRHIRVLLSPCIDAHIPHSSTSPIRPGLVRREQAQRSELTGRVASMEQLLRKADERAVLMERRMEEQARCLREELQTEVAMLRQALADAKSEAAKVEGDLNTVKQKALQAHRTADDTKSRFNEFQLKARVQLQRHNFGDLGVFVAKLTLTGFMICLAYTRHAGRAFIFLCQSLCHLCCPRVKPPPPLPAPTEPEFPFRDFAPSRRSRRGTSRTRVGVMADQPLIGDDPPFLQKRGSAATWAGTAVGAVPERLTVSANSLRPRPTSSSPLAAGESPTAPTSANSADGTNKSPSGSSGGTRGNEGLSTTSPLGPGSLPTLEFDPNSAMVEQGAPPQRRLSRGARAEAGGGVVNSGGVAGTGGGMATVPATVPESEEDDDDEADEDDDDFRSTVSSHDGHRGAPASRTTPQGSTPTAASNVAGSNRGAVNPLTTPYATALGALGSAVTNPLRTPALGGSASDTSPTTGGGRQRGAGGGAAGGSAGGGAAPYTPGTPGMQTDFKGLAGKLLGVASPLMRGGDDMAMGAAPGGMQTQMQMGGESRIWARRSSVGPEDRGKRSGE